MLSEAGLGCTVPIICTLPVLKFSKLYLYDYCLNDWMESGMDDEVTAAAVGTKEADKKTAAAAAEQKRTKMERYLDNVDDGFSGVTTVKYNQTILCSDVITLLPLNDADVDDGDEEDGSNRGGGNRELRRLKHAKREADLHLIKLCAYPSGRTIGGAVWKVTFGTADILYIMNMNMRKEVVLDACQFQLLGESAPLVILDSACHIQQQKRQQPAQSMKKLQSGKEKKGELILNNLIPIILNTLRGQSHAVNGSSSSSTGTSRGSNSQGGGNVIIPVDANGRILELLYVLNKYWHENKGVTQYPLILLSHMGSHIKGYAQCQLEWLSNGVCRSFYSGLSNPLALPHIKCFTSVHDIEMKYSVQLPKVVLVTDSSLSRGLSKELLLKWGGDPRCGVIFTDYPKVGTLSEEIMNIVTAAKAAKSSATASSASSDSSNGNTITNTNTKHDHQQQAPCIVNVTRTQRIPLTSAEIEALEREKEQQRIEAEASLHRQGVEQELAMVSSSSSSSSMIGV